MGASVSFDSAKWANGINNEVGAAKGQFLDEATAYMVADMKSAFAKEGKRDGVDEEWTPTTLVALENRVTYPKGAPIDDRIAYIKSAKTLVDTGNMRDSIAPISKSDTNGVETRLIGASVPYIGTHEKGEGRVPARPNQFFSMVNIDRIKSIFGRYFSA